MTGRKSTFTQEVADIICERLVEGESLRSICSDEDMPNKSTVFRWLQVNEAFRDQYARAKEAQAEALIDEIFDIADDARNDWMEKVNQDGEVSVVLNRESVQRSKLRVDARMWAASKMLPKKYGDKLGLTDGEGGPLQVVINRFGKDNTSE